MGVFFVFFGKGANVFGGEQIGSTAAYNLEVMVLRSLNDLTGSNPIQQCASLTRGL